MITFDEAKAKAVEYFSSMGLKFEAEDYGAEDAQSYWVIRKLPENIINGETVFVEKATGTVTVSGFLKDMDKAQGMTRISP